MKKFLTAAMPLVVWIAAALVFASYNKSKNSAWNRIKNPETVQMLKQFVAMKKAQADAATNGLPSEINSLFNAANRGDWLTLSNSFWKLGERNGNFYRPPKPHGMIWTTVEKIISDLRHKIGWREGNYDYRLRGTPWEAAKEVWGAFDNFILGDEKYSAEFGREIIDSVPAGSIYFGGTDPGRFMVTAMCKSQPAGDPFRSDAKCAGRYDLP